MIGENGVFIIAEAGVNHNGDIEMAFKLIDVAKEAGADAVKFQTFKTENMIAKKASMAEYQRRNIGKGKAQYELIKELELSFDDFAKLKEYCDEEGILFLSSPFDHESVDFLESLVPFYKVPSGEIVNYPYLEHIASKEKPVIMSTGMANLGEVEKALNIIYSVNRNAEVYLLHCTTNYPTPFDEVNLKAMVTLREAFKLPVGYSDHTLGIEVSISAVALGAVIIEKHFTLDKKLPGPDHKASLEPDELKTMVRAIRNVERALGDGIKRPNKSEKNIMQVVRKKLVAARDMEVGKVVRREDIAIKRAGEGLEPEFTNIIVGKRLKKFIKKDEPFMWEHFMEGE